MIVLLSPGDILKDGTPTCISGRSMAQRRTVKSGLYYIYIGTLDCVRNTEYLPILSLGGLYILSEMYSHVYILFQIR